MQNRLSSGKPCANGGTELTLIGYFNMSEGLALRFGSDVSGNANIATLGAASATAERLNGSSSRTIVSGATGITTAIIICTAHYTYSAGYVTYPGYGSCVIMSGSSGNCSLNFSTGSKIYTTTYTFDVTSTSITETGQRLSDGSSKNYGYAACAVLYF